MAVDTTIGTSDAVWEELNRRKQPGDTFDDVLRDVLDLDAGSEPAKSIESEQ
jgi:predicted CopG family antitoxin